MSLLAMRDDSAFAIFQILNAVTPFITPDPPWLANLPLVVAIMAFLLACGLSHIRAERARCKNCQSQEQEKALQRASRAHQSVDLTACAVGQRPVCDCGLCADGRTHR